MVIDPIPGLLPTAQILDERDDDDDQLNADESAEAEEDQ
jgi:hypothetical protein